MAWGRYMQRRWPNVAANSALSWSFRARPSLVACQDKIGIAKTLIGFKIFFLTSIQADPEIASSALHMNPQVGVRSKVRAGSREVQSRAQSAMSEWRFTNPLEKVWREQRKSKHLPSFKLKVPALNRTNGLVARCALALVTT